MNSLIHSGAANSKLGAVLMGALLVVLLLPFPASAVLGGDVSSVQTDMAHMKGSVRLTQTGPYTIHEIQTPTGTTVREYVSGQGTVFGVAWQGPFIPDLQQLLGTYFQQYSAGVQAHKAKYVGRRPLSIQQPGLVVQTGGHMRAYFGRAYVPELVPQGVTIEEIQ